jgi:predicted metal-dependent hydrolase
VRVSRRARRVQVTVSPHEGVVIVVPERFDERRVPLIVARQQAWIERAQGRLGIDRPSGEQPRVSRSSPPERVTLAATGELWLVQQQRGDGPMTSVRARPSPGGGVLLVSGPATDDQAVIDALGRWLTRAARAYLEPLVHKSAADHSVAVGAVSIRSQRTLWGSCSASGNISLNRCLLFLPPALVRYVIVHELCHRREMNHSARFWHLVGANLDDAPERRSELRFAWRYVPSWAL